jgi:hypothetical protein
MMRNLALKSSWGLMGAAVLALGLAATDARAQGSQWPAPSFPNIKKPATVADIMPAARAAARNESGFLGYGFGEVKAGETVILVTAATDPEADLYIEAIMTALKERKVKPMLMREHEIVGVSTEQAREVANAVRASVPPPSAEHGWLEGCQFFKDGGPRKSVAYVKENRPDLYDKCNPPGLDKVLPPQLLDAYKKLAKRRSAVPVYLNKYMDEHPEIRGVFYGQGGPVWQEFEPSDRWIGLMVFDNMMEAMSPKNSFPADVWLMVDEKTIEPAAATDKVTVTDPEGTNVWWELTEEQADRWSRGMYLRGHIFMFPQQAFGTMGGASNVRYPAQDDVWIPVTPIVRLNGTIASTGNHTGFYPHMEEVWENGYLKEVKDGGLYGEMLRTLMKVPGMHDTTWPLREEPGYFYHYETAMATNPKELRPDITRERLSGERKRDGVIHWGLGVENHHDPGIDHKPSKLLPEFEHEKGLPADHGFHKHTYFNTMKLRIRGTERWITLVDKGRSTALDSREVRALASRYGDPDKILATEWIPDVPGINAPGDYKTFSKDPYAHHAKIIEKIRAGKHPFKPYSRPAAK